MREVIKYASIVVSLFVFFYSLLNIVSIPFEYRLIILLPLFIPLTLLNKKIQLLRQHYKILNLVLLTLFIKYVFLTFSQIYYGDFNPYSYSILSHESSMALVMSIYEQIAIFFTLLLYPIPSNVKLYNKRKLKFRYLYIIFSAVLIFFFWEELRAYIIWFKANDLFEISNHMPVTSALERFMFYIIWFSPLILLGFSFELLSRKRERIGLLFLIISLLSLIYFVFSENRGELIAKLLVVVLIIFIYFPKYNNLSKLILIIAPLLIVVSTLIRFGGNLKETNNIEEVAVDVFALEGVPLFLDAYLGGYSSTAQGLKASALYADEIGFNTFISDILINTTVLSQIAYDIFDFDLTENRLSVYLAKVITGSRIPTLLLSGYVYFGFIGSPIFSILALVLLLKFERYAQKASSWFSSVFWYFLAIRFAFFTGLSVSVLFGFIEHYCLPAACLIVFNKIRVYARPAY